METSIRLSSNPHRHEDPFERLKADNKELEKRNIDLFHKYADACFALGLVTGHFPPFNDVTLKRAQAMLDNRKVEWESLRPGQG